MKKKYLNNAICDLVSHLYISRYFHSIFLAVFIFVFSADLYANDDASDVSTTATSPINDDSSEANAQVNEDLTRYTLVLGRSTELLRKLVARTNELMEQASTKLRDEDGQSPSLQESLNQLNEKVIGFAEDVENSFVTDHKLQNDLLSIQTKVFNQLVEIQESIESLPPCSMLDCELTPIIDELVVSITQLTEELKSFEPPATIAVGADDKLATAIEKLADSMGKTDTRRKGPSPVTQIPQGADLTDYYPDANFEHVFVSLPDPRVPRHRRAFENSLNSIGSGLNSREYTLDRYYFPWQDYIDSSIKTATDGSCQAFSALKQQDNSPKKTEDLQDWYIKLGENRCFGILIFRKDNWRSSSWTRTQTLKNDVLIVYVLPETVTYGVLPGAVYGSIAHLTLQEYFVKKKDDKTKILPFTFTNNHTKSEPEVTCGEGKFDIVIAGPVFSGSISSLTASFSTVLGSIGRYTKGEELSDMDVVKDPVLLTEEDPMLISEGLCIYSWSATAKSNQKYPEFTNPPIPGSEPSTPKTGSPQSVKLDNQIDSSKSKAPDIEIRVEFRPLVFTDDKKRTVIARIAKQLRVRREDIYFFVEQSTFGQTICPPESFTDKSGPCQINNIFNFSANIAEVRAFHIDEESHNLDLPFGLAKSELDIDTLDDIKENGSEYPTSHQALLTNIGVDLALELQLSELKGRKPKIIVVAATDVRDRLFLIRHFRTVVPGALVIDFETDILSSHPKFIASSRGMLQLGSVGLLANKYVGNKLRPGNGEFAQSEHQALLRSFFADDRPVRGGDIVVSIIGRDGPTDVSRFYPKPVKGEGNNSCLFKDGKEWKLGPRRVIGCLFSIPGRVIEFFSSSRWMAFTIILTVFILLLVPYRSSITKLKKKTVIFKKIVTFIERIKLKTRIRIKKTILWMGFVLVFGTAVCVAILVFIENVHFNDWDFGFLIVLVLLLPMAWRLSNIWCEGGKSSSLEKFTELLLRFTTVQQSSFEFTASMGVWFGISSLLILIGVLWSEWGFFLYVLPPTASGLAWGLPFVGIVVSTVLAMMFLTAISICLNKIRSPWANLIAGISSRDGEKMEAIKVKMARMKFGLSRALQGGFLLFGTFALIKATPLGVTALGTFSDTGFFLALCATSFVAIGSTALSLNIYERLDLYLSVIRRVTSKKDAQGKLKGLFLNTWNTVPPQGLDQFAVTPIMANPNWKNSSIVISESDLEGINHSNKNDLPESHDLRYTLREMIARKIWCMRWLLILSLLSCLSSVMLVYYYPIPGRDGFLTLNLSLMMTGAILFAVFTVRLERSAIASRLMCDRDEAIKWSFGMINAIALPFILIAIAATVSEVPGVRGDYQ